jgi:hypothetical protein
VVGRYGGHGYIDSVDSAVEVAYSARPYESRAEPVSKVIQISSSIRMAERCDGHGCLGNIDGAIKVVHDASPLESRAEPDSKAT